MVYIVLVIGATYTIYCTLTLLFALKTSKEERSVMIPLFLLFGALGVTAFGGVKLIEAQANPPKLTSNSYLSIKVFFFQF